MTRFLLPGQVPETTQEEMRAAVDSASAAFKTWSQVPVQQRQRVMLKFQALINENMDALSENITIEQGKTLADAKGDVFRGLGKFRKCQACVFAPLTRQNHRGRRKFVWYVHDHDGRNRSKPGFQLGHIQLPRPIGRVCRYFPFQFFIPNFLTNAPFPR
jgi:acyl-CoA reductase-like NAD-dependent aldehyde dehydrogenase